MILIAAFGDRTLHMDLLFYPYDGWDRHVRSLEGSAYHQRVLSNRDRRSTDWRWAGSICHRYPYEARNEPMGMSRYYEEPSVDTCHQGDTCRQGDDQCDDWPGYVPEKCKIGVMGWLQACQKAWVYYLRENMPTE